MQALYLWGDLALSSLVNHAVYDGVEITVVERNKFDFICSYSQKEVCRNRQIELWKGIIFNSCD